MGCAGGHQKQREGDKWFDIQDRLLEAPNGEGGGERTRKILVRGWHRKARGHVGEDGTAAEGTQLD